MNNRKRFLRLFLLASFCLGAWTLQAQTVSQEFKSQPLKSVLKEVEQQTGLSIIYKTDEVNENKLITQNFQDTPVLDALAQILDAGLEAKLQNKMIVITRKPVQQKPESAVKTVNGTVLDERGEPVIGASVVVKGSTTGTITDIDGNYTLSNVPETSTLTISYIGYKSVDLSAKDKGLAKVVLQEDSKLIDEVVVVGYGVQRKRDVTTSISSMRAAELAVPVSSVDQAITGKMAGVQVTQPSGIPGGGMSIKVRGTGSITAGTEPLYVVDGLPMSDGAQDGTGMKVNPLSSINMNDIESIEVLKDASAAAIYGSRGSNGVVIITTKKGKEGKPTVKYDGYIGWQNRTKKIKMLGAYDYARLSYDAHNNAYLDLLEKKGIQGSIADTNEERNAKMGNKAGTVNQAYLLPPEIMPYVNDEQGLTDTDWQDEVLRNAPVQSHNISISGGTKGTQYFISGNYMNEQGIVIGSGFEQMGGRAKIDASYNKFTFGANMSFNHSKYDIVPTEDRFKEETIVASALAMAPIMSVYKADGSYNFDQWNWQYAQPQIVNPVALAYLKEDKMERNRMMGNAYGEYEFIDGLKFRTSFGVDYNTYTRNYFRPSTLPTSQNRVPPSIPTGQKRDKNMLNWVWENTLAYNKLIKQDHNIAAVVGWTAQKETVNSSNFAGTGFPNDLVKTMNAATTATTWDAQIADWSLLSALARVQYAYQNKYMFSAAMRTDGSSRFGKNNRWGMFPSLSAGWYISEEKFMEDLTWLSSLKLRTSYGVSGNFSIGNYEYYSSLGEDQYVYGAGNGALVSGLMPATAGNPDLGWEKTGMFNIGLEVGLFNMITLELDVYNSNTSDMLLNVPVPEFSGFSTVRKNIGKVNNKGVEFSLSTNNTFGQFTWSNRFNISANRNEVKDLGGVDEMLTTSESVGFITKVGKPIGNYYTLVTDGVWANQAEIDNSNDPDISKRKHASVAGAKPGDFRFKDMDGNGVIDGSDKAITGNYMPDFTYGYSTEMKYKWFDLSVAMQGVYGNEIANIFRRYINNMEGGGNCQIDALDRWTSESNPGNGLTVRANRSATGKNGETSTWHIEDGSYLRIKNITFGVTLPKTWLSHAQITNLRVYFSTQNPFTFTKYSGYNPEVNMKGNPLTPGIDYGTYPLAKSYVFGLNVTF